MDRPVRSTRGVRTSPLTEEEKQRENALYSQYFGNQVERESSDSSIQVLDMFQSMSRSQKAQANCMTYPYARASHYFHNLSLYPRESNTSYVENLHPFGTYHDQKITEVYKAQNLINRKYIGLPLRLPNATYHDKNDCHQYLFTNEDRKWRLDQQIYELKFIQKHPQLLENNKCKNYFYLKRDVELSPLYKEDVGIEEKKALLKSKIEFLEMRKAKLYQQIFTEDQFFYPVSRDQQFFNKKQQQQASFDIQNIIVEAICSSVISYSESAQEMVIRKEIESRFSIFTTVWKEGEKPIHPMYQKECEQYFNTQNCDAYLLPSFLMNFNDGKKLDWVGQVLGVRVMEKNGVESFGYLQGLWHKLFGEMLVLNDQFFAVQKWEYVEAIKSLSKHDQKTEEREQTLPQLPPVNQRHLHYFQQSPSLNPLTIKEYLVLYLVYYLYQRANFMKLDYRLVGSPLFDKYQYVLLEKMGKSVINFQLSLKRLTEVIAENIEDTEVPITLKFEFLKAQSLMILWMEPKDNGQEGYDEDQGELGEYEQGEQEEGEQEEGEQGEQMGSQEEDEEDDPQDKESDQPQPQGSIGQFPTKRGRFT